MTNIWLLKKQYPVGSDVNIVFGGETNYFPCPILGHKWHNGELCLIADVSSRRDTEIIVLAAHKAELFGFNFVCYCDRDGSNTRPQL